MSDERFNRLETLIQDLIGIVGKTNAMVADLGERFDKRFEAIEARLERVESHMYHAQVVERRVDKNSLRIEQLSTEFQLLQERQ